FVPGSVVVADRQARRGSERRRSGGEIEALEDPAGHLEILVCHPENGTWDGAGLSRSLMLG
ncbi:MAG: hypothetical protein ABFS46_13740, partial [Myxococcota bacterium]